MNFQNRLPSLEADAACALVVIAILFDLALNDCFVDLWLCLAPHNWSADFDWWLMIVPSQSFRWIAMSH